MINSTKDNKKSSIFKNDQILKSYSQKSVHYDDILKDNSLNKRYPVTPFIKDKK